MGGGCGLWRATGGQALVLGLQQRRGLVAEEVQRAPPCNVVKNLGELAQASPSARRLAAARP